MENPLNTQSFPAHLKYFRTNYIMYLFLSQTAWKTLGIQWVFQTFLPKNYIMYFQHGFQVWKPVENIMYLNHIKNSKIDYILYVFIWFLKCISRWEIIPISQCYHEVTHLVEMSQWNLTQLKWKVKSWPFLEMLCQGIPRGLVNTKMSERL